MITDPTAFMRSACGIQQAEMSGGAQELWFWNKNTSSNDEKFSFTYKVDESLFNDTTVFFNIIARVQDTNTGSLTSVTYNPARVYLAKREV